MNSKTIHNVSDYIHLISEIRHQNLESVNYPGFRAISSWQAYQIYMEVNIQKLGTGDLEKLKKLILLFEDVFEMEAFTMPEDGYLRDLLVKEGFYVFVAEKEGEVLGGLTAYSLAQYYNTSPLVYIYDLAVHTQFQRKGIGRQLISGILDYCRWIGVEEVFVQADEADDYAIDFYRSTGGRPENAVHFCYPLRDGK